MKEYNPHTEKREVAIAFIKWLNKYYFWDGSFYLPKATTLNIDDSKITEEQAWDYFIYRLNNPLA